MLEFAVSASKVEVLCRAFKQCGDCAEILGSPLDEAFF